MCVNVHGYIRWVCVRGREEFRGGERGWEGGGEGGGGRFPGFAWLLKQKPPETWEHSPKFVNNSGGDII